MKRKNFTTYYVKIYDKGRQANLQEEIMRIEFGTKKMRYAAAAQIMCLADLLDPGKLRILGNILLEIFKDILIVDTADTSVMSLEEKDLYLQGQNPQFWDRIKPSPDDYALQSGDPSYNKDRKKYYPVRNRFNKLIEKYNLNYRRNEVLQLMQDQIEQCLITDDKTRDKITGFLATYSDQKGDKITGSEKAKEEPIKVQFHRLNNLLICPSSSLSHPLRTQNDVRREDNQDDSDCIRAVKSVIDNYYDVYYAGPDILSGFTTEQLLEACQHRFGVRLSKEQFLVYAGMVYEPVPDCPF